jgi:putative phosphoesterase
MPPKRAAKSGPRLVQSHVTLGARAGGELLLGVVADTHSNPHPMTGSRLAALQPDAILHAGDIGDLEVLVPLRAIAPLYAVRGNIDARTPGLPDVIAVDVRGEQLEGTDASPLLLRFLLLHIAVVGPRLRAEVARLAVAEGASLIVCGHSHVPFIGRDRGIAMFNPGSVGPRRFQLPIVLGSIAISGGRARLAHIDCETGLPWSPP